MKDETVELIGVAFFLIWIAITMAIFFYAIFSGPSECVPWHGVCV